VNLNKHIYPAVAMTIVLTVLTGIIYPYAITGLAYVLFKEKAQGSLIVQNGRVMGSRLIGQSFSGPGYFHSRPSAAGNCYDATASGGTNLGATSRKLIEERVKPAAEQRRTENPNSLIPVDLVTASASGLDPHITPAAAEFQVPRVSRECGINPEELQQLIRKHTEGRQLGILGEVRVNVLELNLELDQIRPVTQRVAR
jgi:potassium-transporting ATPase KdpC subunit